MIELGELYIESKVSTTRLCCPISVSGCLEDTIWFEVDNEYSSFLCVERSDAFIVAIINYAMINNHDIKFSTAISADLYFNLMRYLIPILGATNHGRNKINLIGDIDQTILQNAGAIGTGISGGIDSLQVISSLSNQNEKQYPISHLMFNNVGSHGEGQHSTDLYEERLRMVVSFCKEYNYHLVKTNSNIHNIVEQVHHFTHTYTSAFAILCLQKLFFKYYYASGVSINNFSIEKDDPAYFDLFLLNLFSVNTLKMYSVGLSLNRLEKTKLVTTYAPSYKYLNVCIPHSYNCGKCEKCLRTLLTLEALEALDLYKDVFDIKYYRSRNFYNKVFLCRQLLKKHSDYKPLRGYFALSPVHFSLAYFLNIYYNNRSLIPDGLVKFIKSLLK